MRSTKTPIEVCHAVTERLGPFLAYWQGKPHDTREDNCPWACMPGELLRRIFEQTDPPSLAALLAAGSSGLVHKAACTNPDFVRDALWWHMWNLPDGQFPAIHGDAPHVRDTGALVSKTRDDYVESDEWWTSRYCGPRNYCNVRWCGRLAVDAGHMLAESAQMFPSLTDKTTWEPNGMTAIALSCARCCSPFALRLWFLLHQRAHSRNIDCLGREDKRRRSWLCGYVVSHIIAQLAYADRHSDIMLLLSNCDALGMDYWFDRLDVAFCMDHITLCAALANSSNAMVFADEASYPRRQCPYGFRRTQPHYCPLESWLPAAVVASVLGHTDRSQKLVALGVWTALAATLMCNVYGGYGSFEMAKIMDALRCGRRIPLDQENDRHAVHWMVSFFNDNENTFAEGLACVANGMPKAIHPLECADVLHETIMCATSMMSLLGMVDTAIDSVIRAFRRAQLEYASKRS